MQPTTCYIVGASLLLLCVVSAQNIISCVEYADDGGTGPVVKNYEADACHLYVGYELNSCTVGTLRSQEYRTDLPPLEEGQCTEEIVGSSHFFSCSCASGAYCTAVQASFKDYLDQRIAENEESGDFNYAKCLWNDLYGGINTICSSVLNEKKNDEIRIAILVKHNTLRSSLALGVVENGQSGKYLRKASKMHELKYTCLLERSAMARAEQCGRISSSNPPEGVSENYHVFTDDIDRDLSTAAKQAIQLWWSEIQKLESPLDQIQNLFYTHFGISSFAKIASDLTTEVGCSVVKCSTQINVVCHYTTTLDNGMKLYTIGPTCKKCSGGTESCVDGLCPVSYTGIDSMCYGALSEFFMSDAMRIAVLAKHNTLRSSLALGVVANGQSGNYLRKASMMYELTYTCSLERSAIERAGQCEDISNSEPPEGVSENYQVFTKNINRDLSTAAKQAIQLWWSEITKLESGLDQVQNIYYTHLGINSFAKIASDLTTEVGCAAVKCSTQINVVCHYKTTLAHAVKLYTAGITCNKCPGGTTSCVNGLCPASSTKR